MNYLEYKDILINFVRQGGPLFGILLPVIEAFIPIMPLVAFVIINVTVFGFFLGYLYSWIGNCLGSYLLFLLLRLIGAKRLENRIKKSKYAGTLGKIRRKNFQVLFFLYCFPFTPSFLISGAAALTNMSVHQFLLILIPSKFVMLLSLSFIGQNIRSFFRNPVRSVSFIVIIILFNILSKKLVEKYEHRHGKS